jgi:hypothetical protein
LAERPTYVYRQHLSIRYSNAITTDEYEEVTDHFNLRHGIQLVDYHIEFWECPTPVHEWLSGEFDYWVESTYGRDLLKLSSAGVIYQPGHEKQPDASFRPRNLPAPDRDNRAIDVSTKHLLTFPYYRL